MLSVVVPTFNEGKNIRNLVTQIDDALKGIPYEIVFVDDSKDDTPQVIWKLQRIFRLYAWNTEPVKQDWQLPY